MRNGISYLLLGLAGLTLQACSATSAASQATSALDTAQCTFFANRAAAEACKQAFTTCVAQTGADVAACRTTLEACLPVPPNGGMGDHDFDGRGHMGPGLFDGGFGPPPFGDHHGHGAGCDGADGGRLPEGPGGRGHGGPGRVLPDPAAIAACHDALGTCLAASPQDTSCFDTERTCERTAFAAAFAAACEAAQPCATTSDPACAELERRCQEGVDGRPGAFDGGACP